MSLLAKHHNLKLAHKAFLLIGVPLFFQVLFVAVLSYMIQQSERETLAEVRSKTIVFEAHRLDALFVQLGVELSSYALCQTKTSAERMAAVQKSITDQFALLTSLARSQQQKDQLARASAAYKKDEELIEMVKKAVRHGGAELSLLRPDDLPQEAGTVIRDTENYLASFIFKEQEGQERIRRSASQSRLIINLLIGVSLLFNILLAFWMAMLFNKSTTARLSVLMDNTKRIAEHKPLNDRIAGDDELAHLDEVVHDMSAKLDELDRMKRDMVAMISHDLRSPLGSIQLFLGTMAEGTYGPLPERVINLAQKQQNSLQRLISLINELLDFEKLASGALDLQPHPVNIDDVISFSIEGVASLAQAKSVNLVKLGPTDITVQADADRLVQVLINLLSNAIKFAPHSSDIRITVENLQDACKLCVSDGGPGIPDKYHQAIFERYRQVEEKQYKSKGGTGLGLPICKLIVELHGGEIGVINNSGAGCTFWFKIPKQQKFSTTSSTEQQKLKAAN